MTDEMVQVYRAFCQAAGCQAAGLFVHQSKKQIQEEERLSSETAHGSTDICYIPAPIHKQSRSLCCTCNDGDCGRAVPYLLVVCDRAASSVCHSVGELQAATQQHRNMQTQLTHDLYNVHLKGVQTAEAPLVAPASRSCSLKITSTHHA
jgi:hypothetical protein